MVVRPCGQTGLNNDTSSTNAAAATAAAIPVLMTMRMMRMMMLVILVAITVKITCVQSFIVVPFLTRTSVAFIRLLFQHE